MGLRDKLGKALAGAQQAIAQPGAAAGSGAAAAHQASAAGPSAGSFDAVKFKMNLKMAKNRINLQKNKVENSAKLQEREIATLLQDNKEEKARVRMEQVVRDQLQTEAFDIVDLFCELLTSRVGMFEVSGGSLAELPPDLKEGVCSLSFAAPRMDIPELRAINDMFKARYGPATMDYVQRVEGENAHCVNSNLVQKLNTHVPEGRIILHHLQKVAEEHNVIWKAPPEYEDLRNNSVMNVPTNSYTPVPFHAQNPYNPGGASYPGVGGPGPGYGGAGPPDGGGAAMPMPYNIPGGSQYPSTGPPSGGAPPFVSGTSDYSDYSGYGQSSAPPPPSQPPSSVTGYGAPPPSAPGGYGAPPPSAPAGGYSYNSFPSAPSAPPPEK